MGVGGVLYFTFFKAYMKLGDMAIPTNEDLGQETTTDVSIDLTEEHAPSVNVDAIDGLTEVTQDGEVIQSTSDAIDGAVDAVANIEEMQNIVQDTVDNGTGSLTDVAVTSLETSLESIMYSIGIPFTVASMESLAVNKRGAHMVATLEASAGDAWNSAVKGLKILLDQTLAFIQNLFRNSWILEKLLKKAQAKVDAVKGGSAAVEKMEATAGTFSIDGTADNSTIERIVQTAFDMMSLSSYAADEINKINFKADREEGANALGGKFILKDGFAINTTIKTDDDDAVIVGFLTKDRGIETNKTGMFQGHSKAFARVVSGGKLASEIAVATPAEMAKRLKNAGDILKEIQKFDSKRNVLKNAVARIAGLADEVGSTYAGIVNKEARGRLNRLMYIRTYRSILNDIIGRMPMESYKIAHGLIQYAGSSAGHYKAE